jgi:hypothetical protein
MLRALLQGPAKKIYCGTGLLLLVLSPYYGRHLLPWACLLLAWCLAALSGVFAFLQDELTLSARAKTLLACAYAIGIVMMVCTYPWPENMIAKGVQKPVWTLNLGAFDLIFPGLFLLPVGAVFIGVPDSPRKWPERAYRLASLCLLAAIAVRCWCDLSSFHLGLDSGLRPLLSELLWLPVWAVATTGMLLASVPHELHRPRWVGSVLAIGYLVAAVMILLTICEIWAERTLPDLIDIVGIAACASILGVLIPAFVITSRLVAHAARRRPG